MNAAIIDHQGKGLAIAEALMSLGITCVPTLDEADILFASTDAPYHTEFQWIEIMGNWGKPVYLYPHSGPPAIEYDGHIPVSDYVTARLVTGPGHKEVMHRYGHSRSVCEVGWFYCAQKKFQPIPNPRKILFAPLHPWADGKTIHPDNQARNARVFRDLDALGLDLQVRYFGDEEANGLPERRDNWVKLERLDTSHAEIDEADLVVATGTFAYLAIARGKPTIYFAETEYAYNDRHDKTVEHWDSYDEYMRYPCTMHSWPLQMLIRRACEGGKWLENWKQLFVGTQMTPERLGRAIGIVLPRVKAKTKRSKHALARRR